MREGKRGRKKLAHFFSSPIVDIKDPLWLLSVTALRPKDVCSVAKKPWILLRKALIKKLRESLD